MTNRILSHKPALMQGVAGSGKTTILLHRLAYLFYTYPKEINDTNTLKLPSYTTVDLTLDYTYNKKTTFSFLLKNLTDELYATPAKNDTGGVYLGEARSFEFGVNYKF